MVRFEPVSSRRAISGHLLYFLAWIAITVCAALLTPAPSGHGTHQQLGLPPCPSVLFYGRPCPGCGLTTAFCATVHGQFATAFHAHPLGTALYCLFTVSAFLNLYGFIKLKRFDTNSSRFTWFLVALTIVFFSFGAWRFFTQRAYLEIPDSWWIRKLR